MGIDMDKNGFDDLLDSLDPSDTPEGQSLALAVELGWNEAKRETRSRLLALANEVHAISKIEIERRLREMAGETK